MIKLHLHYETHWRHSEIKPYADRIWRSVFSEVPGIGRHAIVGMRDIASRIATTKNKGMLSQECRAILSTLGISVMKGDDLTIRIGYREQSFANFYQAIVMGQLVAY